MFQCEICGLGPPDGPAVFRMNKPGEMPAVWRCRKHATQEEITAAVGEEVVEIMDIICEDRGEA